MDTVLVKFAGIATEFEVSKILDLGFTQVRWYGAIIAFGFLLAVVGLPVLAIFCSPDFYY